MAVRKLFICDHVEDVSIGKVCFELVCCSECTEDKPGLLSREIPQKSIGSLILLFETEAVENVIDYVEDMSSSSHCGEGFHGDRIKSHGLYFPGTGEGVKGVTGSFAGSDVLGASSPQLLAMMLKKRSNLSPTSLATASPFCAVRIFDPSIMA